MWDETPSSQEFWPSLHFILSMRTSVVFHDRLASAYALILWYGDYDEINLNLHSHPPTPTESLFIVEIKYWVLFESLTFKFIQFFENSVFINRVYLS